MPSPLTAALLGAPEFSHSGESLADISDRKALALLTYLAVKHQPQQRGDLAELLWGAGKLNNLRQLLYKVRQLDGADDWLTHDDPVTLNVDSDVTAFEQAVDEKRYDEALALWRGNLLEGFKVRAPAFTDWLELQRSRLTQLYEEALNGHLETLETAGKFEEALPLARTTLERDPLNETAHRTLMRLEYKRGNLDAALEQFETLREALRDELEVEPLPETLALLKEIEEGGAGASKRALLLEDSSAIPERPEKLIGRRDLLDRTVGMLSEQTRVLVHGFGGIGKTALAATIAGHYLDQGKVLWLELGQDDPAAVLDALAEPFDAQQRIAQTNNKTEVLANLLKDSGVCLIVLDDVWNAYTLSILLDTLPPEIPLLVTSRQRYPRLKRVNVGRLSREAGLELLSHHAGRKLTKDAGADALCDELGDHAFALRVAGLTLASDGVTPEDLLERVRRAPLDLRVPESLAQQDQGNIASLLQVSLDTLDDRSYDTFLAYGALYSPSSTPELIATLLGRNSEQTEDALFTLVERGLAERVTSAGSDTVTYRVHDLSHAYAQAVNNLREKSVIRAAKHYLQKHADAPDPVDAEISNILAAADAAASEGLLEFMRLLATEGTYYAARGHTPRSVALLKEAATAAVETGDLRAAEELKGKLGDYYLNYLGDAETALKLYEEALELAKKLKDVGREAVYLSLIGAARFQQGEDDSNEYLQQAYDLAKRGGPSFDLCTVLDHNGYIFGLKGDCEVARELFEESLATIETLYEKRAVEDFEYARKKFYSLNNLGQAFYDLKHFSQARDNQQQALKIAREQNNQLWIADALYSLGETLNTMNESQAAREALNEALKLYQENGAKAYARQLQIFMTDAGV